MWTGGSYASDEALLLTRPLLSLKFRYETKRCDFLLEQVAEKRSLTTFYSALIPYWAAQAQYMNRHARRAAFPLPPDFWWEIQLPEGALVELPIVVSHLLSRLKNKNSGWWVVAYTEYAARAAAFLLSEFYDSLMLWYVPPALATVIRSLDLAFVLGSEESVRELHGLLRVIEGTDFRYHAPAQSLRFKHGRGNRCEVAYFIYYDPWEGQVLDRDGHTALRTMGRVQIPAGHPTGFDWTVEVPG